MKKLHTFAFYALVTPVVMLGTGSVLAEQSSGKNIDCEQQSAQGDQDDKKTGVVVTQGDQGTDRTAPSDSNAAAGHQNTRDPSRMEDQDFMDSVPANGIQANDLSGAMVKTTSGRDVGTVDDLIIDENGQVIAIVVGMGGFLGMGQKDVAIGWGHLTRSGTSYHQELLIDVSHEDLRAAPDFKRPD